MQLSPHEQGDGSAEWLVCAEIQRSSFVCLQSARASGIESESEMAF